jgi:polar amino acid transport system permease protein
MVPPFISQSILQLKNTSRLYLVAVPDLMYISFQVTAATYRPLKVWTSVSPIYFAILGSLTRLAKRLELRAYQ